MTRSKGATMDRDMTPDIIWLIDSAEDLFEASGKIKVIILRHLL